MREPHFGIRVVLFAVIAVVSTAAFAADPPTAASLSVKLTEHCTALRTKFEEGTPALGANDCKQAGDTPTKEELAACREVLARISTNAFAPVAKLMTTHHDTIRSEFSDKSKTIQRLHIIFAGREAQFRKVVAEAAAGFWKDFAPLNATTKLRDAATQAKLDEAEKAVGEKLFSACLAADATIIEAAFPSPATLEDLAASSTRLAQQAVGDAERDAFAEFTKAEGFTRSVECLWSTKTENGQTRGALACKPGLLVSGEEVSEIRIVGIPSGQSVRVIAIHAEDLKPSSTCPSIGGDNLTCDYLEIPAGSPQPITIALHTLRWVKPTWGGMWGTVGSAKKVLRAQNQTRSKLSLVTEGTTPTIAVGVTVGSDFAAAFVPVGFARWKVESGGFLSVSDEVDHEVVTKPTNPPGATVEVVEVRDADNVVQDSGIFVNFIPQNYQTIGVSLGLATPSNRRLSIYLGPSIRIRTFGNRGLAALAAGLAMRSVLRFPDVETGAKLAPDSKILQGREQFEFGWFIGLNLGFRIGAFGPQENAGD